ncbi:uncharacterized protein DSM5745_03654 [Aspergillus mulundensis]|uniref:Phytase-like domain-containing protein n=1 Tax=Aspergillus mulundensis TaxID=1810919 RepID=A0A3D8SL75_9EURO|nr:hypothetical protein DSM5745_03654 [Aspergillus mulundensis]RDW87012.1 hypothetical protein DSM5745_03654 [Aspergillus mulundensis]
MLFTRPYLAGILTLCALSKAQTWSQWTALPLGIFGQVRGQTSDSSGIEYCLLADGRFSINLIPVAGSLVCTPVDTPAVGMISRIIPDLLPNDLAVRPSSSGSNAYEIFLSNQFDPSVQQWRGIRADDGSNTYQQLAVFNTENLDEEAAPVYGPVWYMPLGLGGRVYAYDNDPGDIPGMRQLSLTFRELQLPASAQSPSPRFIALPADLDGQITATVSSDSSGNTYCLIGNASLISPTATNGPVCEELYTADGGLFELRPNPGGDEDEREFLTVEASAGGSALYELVFNNRADGLQWRGDEQSNTYRELALFDARQSGNAQPVYGPAWSTRLDGSDGGRVYAFNEDISGASRVTLTFTAEEVE